MKLKKRKTLSGETVEVGSGNIFADLGFDNPEEYSLKAELALQIINLIETNGWTQQEVARRTDLTQPKISDITRGQLDGYSVERLLTVINRLGRNVEVRIARRDSPPGQAHTLVAAG